MNKQYPESTRRFINYGNIDPEIVDNATKESEHVLKQMAEIREKDKNKKHEDFALVKEIMENKDELISKINEIILNAPDKNLMTFLDNHKTYAKVITEYIETLTDTKIKLETCITILEQTISNKQPILEIIINGQKIGKIKDITYTTIYDNVNNLYIIQFDLKNISNKIKILDDTKRQVLFQMVYDGGMTIVYNVRFDLALIDKQTGIVKGCYTSMKQ